MNNNTMHYFIVSAEKDYRTGIVNTTNTEELRIKLNKIGYQFVEAKGNYGGINEISFVVGCQFKDVFKLRHELLKLAESFNQESIAYIDNENRLSLLYANGVSEYIGKLLQDDFAIANYTEINGKKFSAK